MAVCRHPVSVCYTTELPILFAHLFARQGGKSPCLGYRAADVMLKMLSSGFSHA
jgi:hypothetical protein